jgi:pyrroloquinoline quinone (PQQ) biosynthesis protein C
MSQATDMGQATDTPLLSEAAFIARFHAIGEERYHHKHPFHVLMHEGKLTRGQLQAWALNRYYPRSQRRSSFSAGLAQAHPGSRWRRHKSRRNRKVAPSRGSHWPFA